MTFTRRGDIYLVEFDPARGAEIEKTHPALVIQNDIGKRYNSVNDRSCDHFQTLSSPLPYRGYRSANESERPFTFLCGQSREIRSVGRARLLKRLGTLNAGAMRRADEALKISLGLASL